MARLLRRSRLLRRRLRGSAVLRLKLGGPVVLLGGEMFLGAGFATGHDHDVPVIGAVNPLASRPRSDDESSAGGPAACSHPVSARGDGSIRLTLECG